MGKPERRMQRAAAASKPNALHSEALKNLKALPQLMQGLIEANKVLTDEQARLKEIIGDILQDHETRLKGLEGTDE